MVRTATVIFCSIVITYIVVKIACPDPLNADRLTGVVLITQSCYWGGIIVLCKLTTKREALGVPIAEAAADVPEQV